MRDGTYTYLYYVLWLVFLRTEGILKGTLKNLNTGNIRYLPTLLEQLQCKRQININNFN